jgi:hypothetical protein
MSELQSAEKILTSEFLNVRAKVLEIAAALDRLDRAPGTLADASQMKKIRQAIRILIEAESDTRAEQIQQLMSLPYSKAWADEFQLSIERGGN